MLPSRAPVVNSTARFPALDSLRALFVPLMLYHFLDFERPLAGASWGHWVYRGFLSLGFLGLDVFFALSGFLITGILIDAKRSSHYFSGFYARRVLRIVPAYALVVTLIFLLLPAAYGISDFHLTGWQTATYWTFLTNFTEARHGFGAIIPAATPLWSVSVEEQFYLVWPFLVYYCGPAQLKRVCIGCLIAAPLIRLGLKFVLDPVAGYVLMPARVDALAAGALLAIWSREPRSLARFAPWSRPVAMGTVVTTLAIFWHYGGLSPGPTLFQHVILTISPYCAGALLVIVLTAPSNGGLHRLLNRSVLRYITQYSYGTYMLHVPLAHYLDGAGIFPRASLDAWFGTGLLSTIAWGVIMGALSLGAGAVSWHLLEAPLLSLKRYFPYHDDTRRARRISAIQAES